jgi:hypothetical protein
MEFPMISAAEWDREVVAHSAAERAVLRKPQTMRIARLTSAEELGRQTAHDRDRERAAAQGAPEWIYQPRAMTTLASWRTRHRRFVDRFWLQVRLPNDGWQS